MRRPHGIGNSRLVAALLLWMVCTVAWAQDLFPVFQRPWPDLSFSQASDDLLLRDHLLYEVGSRGLRVMDVSVPSQINPVFSHALGPSHSLSFLSPSGLLVGADSGLYLFDLASPSQPRLLRQCLAFPVVDLAGQGGLVYVLAAISGGPKLMIFAASAFQEATPSALGEWVAPDGATGLAAEAGFLVVVERGGLAHLLDVSQPNKPTLLHTIRLQGGTDKATSVAFLRGQLLLASGTRLEIHELSSPREPKLLSGLDLPFDATGLATEGSSIYVSGEGLARVVATLPSAPVLAARLGSSTVNALAISQDLLFVGSSARLRAADWSNPTAPVYLASTSTTQHPIRLQVKGNRLVVADREGISLLGLSADEIVPVLLARYPLAGLSDFEFLSENLLLLWSQESTDGDLLDISRPTQPKLLGTIGNRGGNSVDDGPGYPDFVVSHENKVYIREADATLQFDLSDLNPLKEPVRHPAKGNGILDVNEHFLVVIDSEKGLQFIDWRVPESPAILASFPIGDRGPVRGVAAVGRKAILATEGIGRSQTFPEGVLPSLSLVDPFHPSGPRIIASVAFPFAERYFDLRVIGDRVYVIKQSAVDIFQILEGRFKRIASLPLGLGVSDIAEHGNRIYFTQANGIAIYQWAKPTWALGRVVHGAEELQLEIKGTPGNVIELSQVIDRTCRGINDV